MRKISLFAIMAIIASAIVSCGKSYKANLHTDIDTLSYAIGIANGGQMKGYLMQQGIDTMYLADFVKGFKEGMEEAEEEVAEKPKKKVKKVVEEEVDETADETEQ